MGSNGNGSIPEIGMGVGVGVGGSTASSCKKAGGGAAAAGGGGGGMLPLLGFGTAVWPFCESKEMGEAILHAIQLGYRHFDAAAIYQSEGCLGEAIAQALIRPLIKHRRDLFITSKLWCCDAHPHRVLPALRNTLQKLRLEYVDLYLIHFPVTLKAAGPSVVPFKKEDLVAIDFKGVWEGMEECRRLGLANNIGVSNFSIKKLDYLLHNSNIPPAVNQVEISPLWQQKKLREFCKEKGIHVTAYSPLGAKGTLWGTNHVLDCEVLKEIAEARGKTVAQVCLRWVYEQGVSVLAKSFNKDRIKENMGIFDWSLSTEECHKINQIPQRKGYPGFEFVSDEGPYKSVEEFWDEKIF